MAVLVAGLNLALPTVVALSGKTDLGCKKYCHQWGLETKGLTNCMHKHGDNLNAACVAALVQAGEASQAEVDRRKQAIKK